MIYIMRVVQLIFYYIDCVFLPNKNKRIKMQSKKNQSSVGLMIQRCHKWRTRRKQLTDQARVTSDEIERERLLQSAEHYVRMINSEQGKIDSMRDTKDKTAAAEIETEIDAAEKSATDDATPKVEDDEEIAFPDFITNLN